MNKIFANALLMGLYALPAMSAVINLSGTVTSKVGNTKIQGATLELVNAKIMTKSDSNGVFNFGLTGINSLSQSKPSDFSLSKLGNKLFFEAMANKDLSLTLLDLKGHQIANLFNGKTKSGLNELTLPSQALKTNMLSLRVELNNQVSYYKLIQTASGTLVDKINPNTTSLELGKTSASAAVIDTLKVRKSGYKDLAIAVESYDATIPVAMDGEAIGFANATVHWDFETGALPIGTYAAKLPGQPNARGPLPIIDKLQAHGGVYAMHLDNLTGQPMRDIEFNLPANFGPVLWGRAYIFVTPNAPINPDTSVSSHGALFKGLYTPTTGTGDYWYEVGFEKGKYLQIQHVPEPPGFPEWISYNKKIPAAAAWECVEWEMDGVAPSEPKLFVAGVEIPVAVRIGWDNGYFTVKPADLYKPALNFNKFWLGIDMYHNLSVKTELWYDDVAIAPKRIGCN